MEIIWAPWRMAYITRAGLQKEDCIFCLKPDHKGPDKQRLVLYSDELILVMLNLFPYTNGHLLVAPRRHVASLAQSTEAERLAIMNQAARATEILTKVMTTTAFNMGINQGQVSGGSVEAHLHFHVTPRFMGDANYMTAIGGTRVISEDISDTYDKLVDLFNQ